MNESERPSKIIPLRVFYDGQCIVCDHEVRFYQRRCRDLILVDISAPNFSAESYGKTQNELMAELHVLDSCGNWHAGVQGFRIIWRVVPGRLYDLLAEITAWPVVRSLTQLGYRIFARYRHLLPRYRQRCDDGSCRRPE
ncbi:MAG: DUF393 domain-containing protein [Deltaproteobacteria bacterium]|jgi:predicted DCC family thiol-disulfide oxidoreductase YuxK|nr:DUF393 domain-containing protein [Deltaproteobacteria bacterium]